MRYTDPITVTVVNPSREAKLHVLLGGSPARPYKVYVNDRRFKGGRKWVYFEYSLSGTFKLLYRHSESKATVFYETGSTLAHRTTEVFFIVINSMKRKPKLYQHFLTA